LKSKLIVGLGILVGITGVLTLNFGFFDLAPLYPQRDATLRDVLDDSAFMAPVFILAAVCFFLFCFASWVFYRDSKGGYPLASNIATKFPWLPLLAAHTYLLSIIPAAIFASLLGVLASNLVGYMQGSGLVRVVDANLLLVLTAKVSMIGVVLYAVGCFMFWQAKADPIAFFRINPNGLRATITSSGKEWRIHYQPEEQLEKAGDFFARGLLDFAKEFGRWKGPRPEKIVMRSHLLGNSKREAKQREGFQGLANKIGYALDYPDELERSPGLQKWLLVKRFPKLSGKEKEGGLDFVRKVTLKRCDRA